MANADASVGPLSSPGGIICLHDGRALEPNPDVSATLGAVRQIAPALKDQGYKFEIVSDLLGYAEP